MAITARASLIQPALSEPPKVAWDRQPGRRSLVFLFLTLLALFAYCAPRWNDWNQNSRLSLVRSVVDYGTFRIDAYAAINGDFAYYQGHYYSDKPPGPALAGIVPYAALKLALSNPVADWVIERLAGSRSFSQTFTEGSIAGRTDTTSRDKILGALARIWLSVLLVAAPVALATCLFWLWVGQLIGRYWWSLGLTLALALGTTMFPYSSLYYNHALTAALLFISFFLLHRWRTNNDRHSRRTLALVGFLLGFCLISQYETVLIAGPLALYALLGAGRRENLGRVLWLGLGALPPLVALVVYDLVAFGTPWPIGYQYSILWLDRHSQGFMSLTYPHLEALWGLTFSPFRGLFLLSPFLLLALPGFYFGLKRPGYRLEAGLSLWASLSFFLFNASSVMWSGGHTFGPRYLVSCLPFLALGVGFFLREAALRDWRGVGWWFGLPAVLSVLIVLPATLVGRNWPTDDYTSPLTDYLWPQLFAGNLARNPGMALGLKGPLSFLPLLLAVVLLYLLIFRFRWPWDGGKAGRGSQSKPLGPPETSPDGWVQLSSTVEAGPVILESRPNPPQSERPGRWWQQDRLFFAASVVVLVVVTSLPYLFGFWRANGSKAFMNIMLDVPDTTQYWAWMREMGQSWVIVNPLTPEPNDPVFFNLLWGVLGQVQRLTGLEQSSLYQVFRVGSILFFGAMTWGFCKFIFPRPLAYRTAFLLIMFGSGWGWLPVLFKQFSGTLSNPLAVFVAEPNSFLGALAYPHLIFSAGLLLGVFWLALRAGESGQMRLAVGAAGLALVLGLEHTYDLVIVYAGLGTYWLWQAIRLRRFDWHWLRICLVIGLVSALPSVYSVYLTTTNATWKGVLAQYGNAGVFTPDPFNLLILIGPLLLLALVGLRAGPVVPGEVAAADRLRFVKAWFVAGLFLIYIPTNFQIKMLNGWQVPIFLLAMAALLGPVRQLLERLGQARKSFTFNPARLPALLCGLALLVVLPTTLYLFCWRFVDLNRLEAPYYLQRDELAAMTWLEKANPTQPVVVLSSEELGQYLAPRTGQRPFLAHWAMTLDFYQKRTLSAEVLNPQTTPPRRQAILKQYGVKYILYGGSEKKRGPELNDPALVKVFSSPQADVYRVEPGVGTVQATRRLF